MMPRYYDTLVAFCFCSAMVSLMLSAGVICDWIAGTLQ